MFHRGFQANYTLRFKSKSDGLMTPIGEQWLKRLGSEPKMIPPFRPTKGFLEFAEELGDGHLQAQVELFKMKPENCALVNPFPSNDFTPTQTLRLYRGFYSFSSFLASIINRIARAELENCGTKECQKILNAQCLAGALERFIDLPCPDISNYFGCESL